MNMDFDANKTLVDVIKDVAFEGTYFREIFSSIKGVANIADDIFANF